MKFFSQLVTFVPVVVLSAVGAMAQSSDVVITAIESFTATSSALGTTVSNLNILNFAVSGFVRISLSKAAIRHVVLTSSVEDRPGSRQHHHRRYQLQRPVLCKQSCTLARYWNSA